MQAVAVHPRRMTTALVRRGQSCSGGAAMIEEAGGDAGPQSGCARCVGGATASAERSLPVVDLVDVLRPTTPVASVYIGPDMSDTWDVRWQRIADQLRGDGADEVLIGDVEKALAHNTQVVVFAGEAMPPRLFHMPGLTHPDLAWYTAPAHVIPFLLWSQGEDVLRHNVRTLAHAGVKRDWPLVLAGSPGVVRLAVEGVYGTLDALANRRLRELVVAYPVDMTATASLGELPPGLLADVAVRAAVLSGAQVRLVPCGTPGTPAGGIGGELW